MKIKDLISNNELEINTKIIQNKYGIQPNLLHIMQLKAAIPKKWKDIIKNSDAYLDILDTSEKGIRLKEGNFYLPININSKIIYNILRNENIITPAGIEKWKEILQKLKLLNDDDWKNIFANRHKTCQDTRIHSMQYKLLNRLINCKVRLYDWKLSIDKRCKKCNMIDTIEHFLFNCTYVKGFWLSPIQWWDYLTHIVIDMNRDDMVENFIFGFNEINIEHWLLNFIIQQAKFYIYNKKQFESQRTDFYDFLPRSKTNIKNIKMEKKY